MKQSPLRERHLALGARLVEFAGWELPVQYSGVAAEHAAVRERAGIFDISHMGQFEVEGPESAARLESLLTNECGALAPGEGHYTLLLNEDGGVIDDLLLYRTGPERWLLVVNAARAAEDAERVAAGLGEGASLRVREGFGAVAVQGPESAALWEALEPGRPLPPRNGIRLEPGGAAVCRTGYTGEDGFELFAPAGEIGAWFDRFIEAGAAPCGLGARDTLRLEKCYPLNGADLRRDRTPLEAGLGFFVKMDKPGGFTGREALAAQRESGGPPTRLAALRAEGKGPPFRPGYEVVDPAAEGAVLGTLTSGTLSPGLGLGIGLAYLPAGSARPGTELAVSVRGRIHPARVVKKPFV